jgi:hypothetical protein
LFRYNIDHQTPDSAATATAYLCGVKAQLGTIGVDGRAKRANCTSSLGTNISSIVDWAQELGNKFHSYIFLGNQIFLSPKVKKLVLLQQLALLMQHQLLLMRIYLNVTGKVMIRNILVLINLNKVVLILLSNLSYVIHQLIFYLVVVVDSFILKR